MKVLVVLSVLVSLSSARHSVCGGSSFPGWPAAYSVRGVINIPYAELQEPFMAYYDGTAGSSRIDYYGDVKTYQISTMGDYGSMMKVVPTTTESELNAITCLQVNGTIASKITPQSILPALDRFQCVGKEIIDSVEAEKWVFTNKTGDEVFKYTMWLTFRKSNFLGGKDEPVPIRYETKVYNSLLGSYSDHHYLSFYMYSSDAPASSVWQLDANLTCKYFPGLQIKSIASFNPIKEFVNNYDEHIEDSWNDFKKKYNKNFVGAEHHKRRQVFRDNHRFIHSMNRAGLGYHLKLNHYADWTDDEMKVLRGRRHSVGGNNASVFPYTSHQVLESVKKIPDNFNWRLYGAVTPVKDQYKCGSCWSFGTTGSVEGAYFVKTGLQISLSEQALVDCSWGYGNNGCDGGNEFTSYQWIMKHGGIPLDGDYGGYLAQDGYCHINDVKLVAPITGYVSVTPNDENALRLAMFKHGPISIAIDATKKTFSFYSHGVYSDPSCSSEDLDHAVLAVGYGEMNGKKYWLVKNSWSNLWGNDGYILIASENNICGVMTSPTYVTM